MKNKKVKKQGKHRNVLRLCSLILIFQGQQRQLYMQDPKEELGSGYNILLSYVFSILVYVLNIDIFEGENKRPVIICIELSYTIG